MIRKVLVMNNIVEGKVQTKGLLSLEVGNSLNGKLRVFDVGKENATLILKIGPNALVFDSISEPENFMFETVYHSLNMPICAVVTDGAKIFAYGKTEGFEGDYKDLLKELAPLKSKDFEQKDMKNYKGKDKNIDVDNDAENTMVNDDDFEEKNENNFEIPYQSQVQARRKKSTNTLSEDIEDAESFLQMVQPQIDELFSKNEHFVELEQMIENTEWVKVPYLSEDNDHYILGKILTNGEVSHICYGIPASNNHIAPPVNLEQYCQWLPVKADNPDSNGYWVMYQDAKTGENIEINN